MIGLVEDRRPKFAAFLREVADRMEQSDKQPVGCFVQVFMGQSEMIRAERVDDGFNLMEAIACHEVCKLDLAHRVLAAQKRIP